MLTVFLSCLVVVTASFVCAISEAAILSLPFLRARIMLEEKRHNARDVMYIKENIAVAVATIVIINNSINIIGSVFIGREVARILGDQWLGIASGVLTFIIIIFGEVIPKAIGERFKIPISLFFAKPIRILMWLFRPVVGLAMILARPWTKGERGRVTEEEIKMMLKLGRDAGTVESDEEILINHVFRLNDLQASNIMKPLEEAYMLPADKTLMEAKDAITMSPYNRIAVYQGDPNRIVGIVQHRILLRELTRDNHSSKIKDWMLKPIFVNQSIKVDALMAKFQAYHQHLFVVQDHLGHNVGLVTMEDVLEELFGEIYDEKDVRFKMMEQRSS